jgi:hypothetical protein
MLRYQRDFDADPYWDSRRFWARFLQNSSFDHAYFVDIFKVIAGDCEYRNAIVTHFVGKCVKIGVVCNSYVSNQSVNQCFQAFEQCLTLAKHERKLTFLTFEYPCIYDQFGNAESHCVVLIADPSTKKEVYVDSYGSTFAHTYSESWRCSYNNLRVQFKDYVWSDALEDNIQAINGNDHFCQTWSLILGIEVLLLWDSCTGSACPTLSKAPINAVLEERLCQSYTKSGVLTDRRKYSALESGSDNHQQKDNQGAKEDEEEDMEEEDDTASTITSHESFTESSTLTKMAAQSALCDVSSAVSCVTDHLNTDTAGLAASAASGCSLAAARASCQTEVVTTAAAATGPAVLGAAASRGNPTTSNTSATETEVYWRESGYAINAVSAGAKHRESSTAAGKLPRDSTFAPKCKYPHSELLRGMAAGFGAIVAFWRKLAVIPFTREAIYQEVYAQTHMESGAVCYNRYFTTLEALVVDGSTDDSQRCCPVRASKHYRYPHGQTYDKTGYSFIEDFVLAIDAKILSQILA